MTEKPTNVLFLCTGNSARSILAEAVLNRESGGRFKGFSAGSRPTGQVHPMALELLTARGYPTDGLHSKSWEVFAGDDAPHMDLIVTVCDNAAGEVCPVWPGRPASAHWPFPDPAACRGEEAEQRAVFAEVHDRVRERIRAFMDEQAEK